MRIHITKEARKRRASDSQAGSAPVALEKQPVPSQPVSSCDDLQARIATRAYEIHLERGYCSGYALSDWLEAEREILGLECNA